MKFKIDENLPAEAAVLRGAGFGAATVGDEDLLGADDETIVGTSRSEDRILVTLDLDFANTRAYPPGEHAGIIVLRSKRQDKLTVPLTFGAWQQLCRTEIRPTSCRPSTGTEYVFDKALDRCWAIRSLSGMKFSP